MIAEEDKAINYATRAASRRINASAMTSAWRKRNDPASATNQSEDGKAIVEEEVAPDECAAVSFCHDDTDIVNTVDSSTVKACLLQVNVDLFLLLVAWGYKL